MGNKVTFGLKNVHYAVITEEELGTITYATPKPLPGGIEISIEPKGEMTEFYADDVLYYSASTNQGYEGTLKIANITDEFCTEVLAEVLDETDQVISEVANAKTKPFALLFEFDGDVKAVRHVLYNCSANRPTVASTTKTSSTEPNENELSFTAGPRSTDYKVKTKTTDKTTETVYNNWYKKVYEKTLA